MSISVRHVFSRVRPGAGKVLQWEVAVLLYDSEHVPPERRTATIANVLAEPALSTAVLLPPVPHMKLEAWELADVGVMRVESSPMRVVRTPRRGVVTEAPAIALGVYSDGVLDQVQSDRQVRSNPGELFLLELNEPHDHQLTGEVIRGCAVRVPMSRLGVTAETVRAARGRLTDSPVYHLLQNHLLTLADTAEEASRLATADVIGRTTVDLVRTLLLSAGGGAQRPPDPADHLLQQVLQYARDNLQDPDLSAAQIASANHVSVRHMYNVCAAGRVRLREWIVTQRLEGAKCDLANPEFAGRTIFDIAGTWGFVDPSHFSARFREAFDVSPRQWREQAKGATVVLAGSAAVGE